MLSLIIEFLPLAAFFIAYKWADIFWATGILIGTSLIQLLWFRVREGQFKPMRVGVFLALLLFGSLTIWFHDPDFVKWKVTIVLSSLALVLAASDWWLGKPLIRTLFQTADNSLADIPDRVWRLLTCVWVGSYVAQAVANYVVAFHYPEETWVNFKVWGLTAANLLTVIATVTVLTRHAMQQENHEETD